MRPALPLLAALVLSMALKASLQAAGVLDFTGDEGVVALMARHITQGKWPVFYYGEAYVGSLGATLIAGAFLLLGESVATIRITQMLFYAGAVLFTYLLAERIFDRRAAFIASLMMALPPVMVTLYTTVAIGAYGETLLFGTCLLWLGHRLAHDWADRWLGWLAWGAVAGLGFWSLGLIVAYAAPVAILLLLHFRRAYWRCYLLAVAGFLLCSSPWWIYDFTHEHAALRVLFDPSVSSGIRLSFSPLERMVGFFLLGIPALLGLRFPWAPGYILVYLAPAVLAFYTMALVQVSQRSRALNSTQRSGALLLVLFVAGFGLSLVSTRFGIDATGRYLLPLYPMLSIVAGGSWSGQPDRQRVWSRVAVALILAFNLTGVVLASRGSAGLTTQPIDALQMGNDYDQALIDFLVENEMPYGYSHHWVSFKLAFLSGEDVILAPLLPYLSGPPHDPEDAGRYPPYTAAASSAPNPVYVTSNQPWLDDTIRERLGEQNIAFRETAIGPYRVFHHLSWPIRPERLGPLGGREPEDVSRGSAMGPSMRVACGGIARRARCQAHARTQCSV